MAIQPNRRIAIRTDLFPYQSPEHQPFEIGAGPAAALLIHGFPGTPSEVLGVGKALAKDGWHVRGILLPGFGPQIPELERFGRKDWIQAALRSWDELNERFQPVVLMGYSMGAAIALHVARVSPPDRLVLAAPFWHYSGIMPLLLPLVRRAYPRIRPFRKVNFSDQRYREMFDRILPEADLDDPSVQETIRNEFIVPLKPLEEVLRLGKEAYQIAGEIHSPTLVIQGRDDLLVKRKETQKLVNRFPASCAQLRIIDSSHDILADCCEQKDLVYRLICEFLDGVGEK